MSQHVHGAMLTTSQLAAALQVSVSTIKRWKATGKIEPAIATGKVVRYRWPVEVVADRRPRARPVPVVPSLDSNSVVVEIEASSLPGIYADAIASFGGVTSGRALVAIMPLPGELDGESA